MKKRTIILLVSMILAGSTAFGQIIYTNEDQYGSNRENEFGVMVPMQNVNTDQFKEEVVPLGNGLLLLAGLAGGYLLKKKKEERRKK